MKNRFKTLDLIAIIPELKEKLIGNRVYQVYDVDNKTYLIRFTKPTSTTSAEDEISKQILIIESGIRIHLTEYDWPKNTTPSGFTMKLRKHLKNKRLEAINQIQNDRVVDLQFGSGEYANHIILELFSKGNIVLTDNNYVILSFLRHFKNDNFKVNISVNEKYPVLLDGYFNSDSRISKNQIADIIFNSKERDFRKLFNPHFIYGSHLMEHSLMEISDMKTMNNFKISENDLELLEKVFKHAESLVDEMRKSQSKGYLVVRMETNDSETVAINDEFHPFRYKQFESIADNLLEFESFNKAVDVFFSNIEMQKIKSKSLQNEKQAIKKLEAFKKDHESRVETLTKLQEIDDQKASLIENNIELVDSAIMVLRSAIANKFSWSNIAEMVKDAQEQDDPIASKIKELKLEKNSFTMLLNDPYDETCCEPMNVDIDIDLSAYANAKKFYDHRKDAVKKVQKTINHSEQAYKNVEKKIKQQLKENSIKTTIVMSKKILWFEKFFWFISSEGFIVIAGRDAQQNELIVKRYLDKNDIYVHANIHGATSVVIKNHTDGEIPPKTLNEAANMAVCYSASWDSKVISNAYWVYSHQIQKTAPTGQYLSVGSFMIRGKKNFIPLQNLILGFGILFRIDDESLERRQQSRLTTEQNEILKENDEEKESFPDTVISYKNLVEQSYDKRSENDVTIVNTGENVKKKVKIFTQKDAKRKTNQEQRIKEKIKKKNRKDKMKTEVNTDVNQSDQTVVQQAKNSQLIDESAHESKEKINGLQQKIDGEDNLDVKKDVEDDHHENDKEIDLDEDANDGENVVLDEDDDDDHIEANELRKNFLDTQKIISSLISNPETDDNLLYAIPVCGPYASIQSYKYKIKITPGQTRRGKASKTALMMFLKEKSATNREKDLLKAINDQDLSRNLPSKVKIVNVKNAK